MTRYHSIIGMVVSSLVPIEKHATPSPPISGLHTNDAVVFGPLIPLIIDTVASSVSTDILNKFTTFSGNGSVQTRQLRTNTEDPTAIRNVTVWLGDNLAIGGQSVSGITDKHIESL